MDFVERSVLEYQVQHAFEQERARIKEARWWSVLNERWQQWWSSVEELTGNLANSPWHILTAEENANYKALKSKEHGHNRHIAGHELYKDREYPPLTQEEEQLLDGLRARIEQEMKRRQEAIFPETDKIRGPTVETAAKSLLSDNRSRYILIAHIFGERYMNGTGFPHPFSPRLMDEIDSGINSLSGKISAENVAGILYAAQFADPRFLVALSEKFYHNSGLHWAVNVKQLVEPAINGLTPTLMELVASNLHEVSLGISAGYRESGVSPEANSPYAKIAYNLLRCYIEHPEINIKELEVELLPGGIAIVRDPILMHGIGIDKMPKYGDKKELVGLRLMQINTETALALKPSEALQRQIRSFAETIKLPLREYAIAGK